MSLVMPAELKANDEERAAVMSDRGLAAWEIASVVSSILIAEWILSAVIGRSKLIVAIPIGLAFVLIIGSHRLRGETIRDLGFRFDNFLSAGRLLLLPMLVTADLCLMAGWGCCGALNCSCWPRRAPMAAALGPG